MFSDMVNKFAGSKEVFLIEDDVQFTYEQFYLDIRETIRSITAESAVALEANSTYYFYVKFLALLYLKIPVTLVPGYQFNDDSFRKLLVAECQMDFYFSSSVDCFENYNNNISNNKNEFVENQKCHPLFIIKTSGSSGKKFKFVLHSAELFIYKHLKINKVFKKTLAFSPAESVGGVETLLEVLALGKTLVTCGDRPSVKDVVGLIKAHGIDLVQTTPSFLNLLIFSGMIKSQDLKSVKSIYFGSEQISENTINLLKKELPWVRLVHTYGMSEIGILLTETLSSQEWLTRPKQCEINNYRIEDNILLIKSKTQMLGYLNHNYITKLIDGQEWFDTGDQVLEEKGYLKIIGRSSDLANVGGRKFYPFEVEEKLLKVVGVKDVVVIRDNHELLGNIIIGRFILKDDVDEMTFRVALKKFSEENLPPHMRLHKVELVEDIEINFRSKKVRVK